MPGLYIHTHGQVCLPLTHTHTRGGGGYELRKFSFEGCQDSSLVTATAILRVIFLQIDTGDPQ